MDSTLIEAGVSNTISSPGTAATGVVENDGSCIPVRRLGSVEVPAIITGMWQVAGRHGTIDVKKVVNEMKLYAFAGLGVFDMADIYGPAKEIYGLFCKDCWGSKPIRQNCNCKPAKTDTNPLRAIPSLSISPMQHHFYIAKNPHTPKTKQ